MDTRKAEYLVQTFTRETFGMPVSQNTYFSVKRDALNHAKNFERSANGYMCFVYDQRGEASNCTIYTYRSDK